jgi:type I restriction enzyme R subunit
MSTDTSEKGLEALIVAQITRLAAGSPGGSSSEEPELFVGPRNWLLGDPKDYDRSWTVDLAQLSAFAAATQPPLAAALVLDVDFH